MLSQFPSRHEGTTGIIYPRPRCILRRRNQRLGALAHLARVRGLEGKERGLEGKGKEQLEENPRWKSFLEIQGVAQDWSVEG